MLTNINRTLTKYKEYFPTDHEAANELLRLIEVGAFVTERSEFKGHVTCGAILLNSYNKLLMIHHIALDKWLFPGGHLEGSDISLRGAALRELLEETGINENSIISFGSWVDEIPVHLDCHPIPANSNKGEPDHRHWDFRFLFRANEVPITLQEDEVKGFNWVEPTKAPKEIVDRLLSLGIISGDDYA